MIAPLQKVWMGINDAEHSPAQSQAAMVGPLRISRLKLVEVLGLLDAMRSAGQQHSVSFCEANLLVAALEDPTIAQALNESDLILPDGMIVMLWARANGQRLPERIPGPGFMLAACEHGLSRGYRHYFYGGEEGVADELAMRLQAQFPGLIVAGTYCPPFRPLTADEEVDLYRQIEAARPDLLWVGLGGPKQALWMSRHKGKLPAPIMLGVGAAFDFHSGRVPWAPLWIRKIGMEWAFRALTGGRRLFLRNLRCVPLAFFSLLSSLSKGKAFQRSPTQQSEPAKGGRDANAK